MKRYALVVLIAVGAAPTVFAACHPLLAGREQSAREAAQRQSQSEQQDIQRMYGAAQAKARPQVTSKTLQELKHMSDAEALSLELATRYGQ